MSHGSREPAAEGGTEAATQPAGRRQASGRFHFRVATLTVQIEALCRAGTSVIEDTLGGLYELVPGPAPHADVTIRVAGQPAHVASRAAEVSGPGEPVLLLNYPGLVQRGHRWRRLGVEFVQNDDAGVWCAVDRDAAVFELAGPAGALHAPLTRTVRLILDSCLAARGYARLHSAGLVLPTGVVAIVGESGSGKTTLVLELLRGAGGRIVSFDTMFWKAEGASAVCAAPPHSLGLGVGTAMRFGLFLGDFGQAFEGVNARLAWGVRHARTKARIPPERAAQVLPMAAGGPFRLRTVLFPSIAADVEPVCTTVTADEAAVLLMRQFEFKLESTYDPDWIRLCHASVATRWKTARTIVERLTAGSEVGFYRVSFGGGSPAALMNAVGGVLDAT